MNKRKSRSKFGYDNFTICGTYSHFIVHADKYTREEVLELFAKENEGFENKYREPTLDDISEGRVKHYIRAPHQLGREFEGDCYSFADKNVRGSFPVYIIHYNDLKKEREDD